LTVYPLTAAPPGSVLAVQLTVTFRLEPLTVGVFPVGMTCAFAEAEPEPLALQPAQAAPGATAAAVAMTSEARTRARLIP
jgi:hypothetical protein